MLDVAQLGEHGTCCKAGLQKRRARGCERSRSDGLRCPLCNMGCPPTPLPLFFPSLCRMTRAAGEDQHGVHRLQLRTDPVR